MYDHIKSHDLDELKQQGFEDIQLKIKKREEDGYVSSKESSSFSMNSNTPVNKIAIADIINIISETKEKFLSSFKKSVTSRDHSQESFQEKAAKTG